jgi:TatD DNase family protein
MHPELFDSHTHLDIGPLREDVGGVLDRARAVGVTRVMAVGCCRDPDDAREALNLCRDHLGVWVAIGVHPHDASCASDSLLEQIEELAESPEVVALGEMGLDYHYMRSPAEVQREAFRRQLRLARRAAKPVILHLREATSDALAILKDEGLPAGGGVVHCYSEGPRELEDFLPLGLHIAFSGIVTFPGATKVQEAARLVPSDKLLVETDAPYLAPIPHRGRTNEASLLPLTAAYLARLRGVPLPTLASETTANALKLLGIGGH